MNEELQKWMKLAASEQADERERGARECSSWLGVLRGEPHVYDLAHALRLPVEITKKVVAIEEGLFVHNEYRRHDVNLFSTYQRSKEQHTVADAFGCLLQEIKEKKPSDGPYSEIIEFLRSNVVLPGGQRLSVGEHLEVIAEEAKEVGENEKKAFDNIVIECKKAPGHPKVAAEDLRTVLGVETFKHWDRRHSPKINVVDTESLPKDTLGFRFGRRTRFALWFEGPAIGEALDADGKPEGRAAQGGNDVRFLLRKRAVREVGSETHDKAREGIAKLHDLGGGATDLEVGSGLKVVDEIAHDLVGESIFEAIPRKKGTGGRSRGRPRNLYRVKEVVNQHAPFTPCVDRGASFWQKDKLTQLIGALLKYAPDERLGALETLVEIVYVVFKHGKVDVKTLASEVKLKPSVILKYLGKAAAVLPLHVKKGTVFVSQWLPFRKNARQAVSPNL